MKVPIWRVLKTSWRDVWRAFGAMPKMALILFAVSCVSALPSLLKLQSEIWNLATMTFIIPFATAALYAPALIALHRYVLMDEFAGRYEFDLQSRRFLRYFGYSLVFVLLAAATDCADILAKEHTYGDLVIFAGLGILLAALVWATLIFPAIAVDASNIGWVAAFRDLRGNFWRTFGIGVVIVVPAFVILLPSLMLDPALTDSFLESRPIKESEIGLRTVFVWLLWGALYTLMTALWAVAASHLYRMLANDLRRNTALEDGPSPAREGAP